MYVGFDFGVPGVDSIFAVTVGHTLSARQFRFAMWVRNKLT